MGGLILNGKNPLNRKPLEQDDGEGDGVENHTKEEE